jgi:uncharacterized OsmC-like protein
MGYPIYFTNYFVYKKGKYSTESPLKDEIQVSYPKEFHGDPRKWTPTELFLSGLNSALVLHFLTRMENLEIRIPEIQSTVSCKIENKSGTIEIIYVKFNLKIKHDSIYHLSRIEEVLEKIADEVPEIRLIKDIVEIDYSFQ